MIFGSLPQKAFMLLLASITKRMRVNSFFWSVFWEYADVVDSKARRRNVKFRM